jgi:hypothetical protein
MVRRHCGKHLLLLRREFARLGILGGFDHNHESHYSISCRFGIRSWASGPVTAPVSPASTVMSNENPRDRQGSAFSVCWLSHGNGSIYPARGRVLGISSATRNVDHGDALSETDDSLPNGERNLCDVALALETSRVGPSLCGRNFAAWFFQDTDDVVPARARPLTSRPGSRR